ncbi:Alpha-1,2 mannosyltransferase KTR1 [Fulvia fulva]|uniref:Alpha-1,2 mannosyltransferase KTR1 n=1 Tax=Passalora fulva TaxID=5499 RepID=A0A9Q8PFD0_PASFU|nr:Alpha-1,2 mannosyltransferase KTR1 [Fulvia fulva]KAK4617822.1 Alpha-1,2 mannosyltransferase KTR1 [Fulvia fulva]KAK4619130.1 Alpha-1,2 mannosyltransferase KTR1 [Fulvia fulva]UJO21397.1 Alpha-1,2 mannosyltransferase KTR1 [Fulvia fulva]WPV18112.1 Alpha-1,2 mannosyltransferase KTR1 [Fulvia fulva]WPV33638.1 Alpha-1,2 mannosyltransferase KTR1 [Fulvia fulva]
MAGSTRYLRYILAAFVALVFIFILSSSSTRSIGQEHLTSAAELLKQQGIWKGSESLAAGQKSSFAEDSAMGSTVNPAVGGVVTDSGKVGSTKDNTSPNPGVGQTTFPSTKAPGPRMNATFVTLARNSDVWEISRSIRQVEDRFNHNYNYDWVFLNDAEFDDQFKKITTALTSGKAKYGKIDSEHWGFPEFIDQEKAKKVREDMHERKIIYGDSISYRHMCRYESGFFFRHPLMLDYEWYWRVEPSIELYCDVAYDPFKFMADNKKKYSFVLSLYEYVETIPTLWDSVKKFMKQHPEHLSEDNSMEFLSDDGGETYNHCHFWSNFEIGNLNWLRSKQYIDYFTFLDKEGGFFYERWGDAPIHSIAAGLMLKKEEIHFFNDIAYYHVPFTHCPTGEQMRLDLKCHCNPKDNFDWNGYSCTNRWYDTNKIAKPEGYEKEQ